MHCQQSVTEFAIELVALAALPFSSIRLWVTVWVSQTPFPSTFKYKADLCLIYELFQRHFWLVFLQPLAADWSVALRCYWVHVTATKHIHWSRGSSEGIARRSQRCTLVSFIFPQVMKWLISNGIRDSFKHQQSDFIYLCPVTVCPALQILLILWSTCWNRGNKNVYKQMNVDSPGSNHVIQVLHSISVM